MTTSLPPLEQRFGADLAEMQRQIRTLQTQMANLVTGAVSSSSTGHPPNPAIGMRIYETDTGLEAYWSGTAWVYPPQLIAPRQVLGAPSASVTFSGIPQVFTNLRLEICAKSDGTGGTSGYDNAFMQFNGVTAANYNWQTWYKTWGAGAVSVADGTSNTSFQIAAIWNNHFTTAGRGIATVEIPSYSDTSNLKGFTSHSPASDGGTAGVMQLYGGFLGGSNTAAITSIKILMTTGSFIAGSTFSLYGLG